MPAETAGDTPAAIETRGLTKVFGSQRAVDDVNLTVPRGAVFGFLGPNGSGKTTTIRLLLGLAAATTGQISVLGRPMPASLHDVLPRVGALVEGPGFYPYLSGAANLRRLDTADRHAASGTRVARVRNALERVGLAHAAHKKVHAYSLGMKQRLGIANALLTPRDLLVLDEPTNGLDPQGTREVRSLVASLAAEGTTVFVSSHLLAEIEQMCTHAAVMSAGRLVAQGSIDELRRVGAPRMLLVTPDPAPAMGVLRSLGLAPSTARATEDGATVTALLTDATAREATVPDATVPDATVPQATVPPALTPEAIVTALVNAGVRVRGFQVQRPSLEDRFVALTGEGFDVVG